MEWNTPLNILAGLAIGIGAVAIGFLAAEIKFYISRRNRHA